MSQGSFDEGLFKKSDVKRRKEMTMMRLGELHCFDESQRIAIFEMVKTGAMSIEDALGEVKSANPVTFNCKYLGCASAPAPTLKPSLSDQQGLKAIALAQDSLKRLKVDSVKVGVTISTVGIRILDENEETIENEPMSQIAYSVVLASDKKKVAYVTSYSKLGLEYVHFFSFGKSKEATDFIAAISSRKAQASQARSLVPATGIDRMSVGVDEDEVDDPNELPQGVYPAVYLGSTPVLDMNPDLLIAYALEFKKDHKLRRASDAKSSPRPSEIQVEFAVTRPVDLVVTVEGIRSVDVFTKEIVHNVLLKAVPFMTNKTFDKKEDIFFFVEVDDRRDSKVCHIFASDKQACINLVMAFQKAAEIGKAMRGNPFAAIGIVREKVEGPLAGYHISRKLLTPIKAIGAGQFGKVYLATQEPGDKRCAVKLLRGGASVDDRTEFLREGETMLAIGSHPHIVTFLGGDVKQRPWLAVLEFCQYGDLSDVLTACRRKKIPLSIGESLNLAIQLAKGLEYVASKRYVHMDVAARNCLLSSGSVLKLGDFGLARPIDPATGMYRQQGVMKLSVRWLAIDSFECKLFSEKSDVWSFAVTVWEIFSLGAQPYPTLKLPDVLKTVRSGLRLPRPEQCPEAVFQVLFSCWSYERESRPRFGELITALGTIQQGHPGEIRDIGALLSSDLDTKLKHLSIRVKKNTESGNLVKRDDAKDDNLVGAVDVAE